MPIARKSGLVFCGALALLSAGCGLIAEKKAPRPIEFALESPYAGVKTVAVAPAINLSGSRDFDPLTVSDALFVELQQVQDLNVLPLNKTIMAMNRLGMRNIDDVKGAQRLADALGADALVIPAITAYDPYNPPTVGMVLELYTSSAIQAAGETTPVKLTGGMTAPQTEEVKTNMGGMVVVAENERIAPPPPLRQPVARVSAVFNANNQTVLREVRDFAIGRTQYDSALLDQKFLADSDSYMRFVCHAMVRRLMDVERTRAADR